jgi:hypothetical protein
MFHLNAGHSVNLPRKPAKDGSTKNVASFLGNLVKRQFLARQRFFFGYFPTMSDPTAQIV